MLPHCSEVVVVDNLSTDVSTVTVNERCQSVKQILANEQWFHVDRSDVDGVKAMSSQTHLLMGDWSCV